MARAAKEAGLACVCFTDHYDVINEKGELCPHYDWTSARRQQREVWQHMGAELETLYGIELGNAPADFAAAERALAEPGLDFVIGSIHNASPALGGIDYYYVDYAEEPEKASLHLRDYLESLLAVARWGNYDSLGHIPYPLRYMRQRAGLDIHLNRERELVEEILCTVVRAGKAIEINTYRGRGTLEDYVDIVKRFRELGGEFVTCGADAHRAEDAGKGLKNAYELLEACGFRYVTVYRQRESRPVKL
jgi:histidinol-phosphatase (PHP family)